MMNNTPLLNAKKLVKRETKLNKHIPYARFCDAETIETKNGNLLQIIKLDGLFSETMDEIEIISEKNKRNGLWMSLTDSSTLFYFHTIRRKIDMALSGEYIQDFCRNLHEKWQGYLNEKDFYINEHYMTVVKKPPVGRIRRLSDLMKSLNGKLDREAREQFRKKTITDLNKITQQIIANLANYGARKLMNEVSPSSNEMTSEALSFLSYLINLERREIIVPRDDLSNVIGYKRLFFDNATGTIALRDNQHKTIYASILSLKNYTNFSYPKILDSLLNIKAELIITQSFNPIEKSSIRSRIKEEQRNNEQSDDGETTASSQINITLNEMGSGQSLTGTSHFSILCQGESQRELEENIATIEAVLNQIGFIAVREDVGIQPVFFAMLPSNHMYIARPALLSSKNIASFASFHNTYIGKSHGHFWGETVTVLETMSGAPFYFNFHVMDVGNTFMIGSMGTGKTLLEAFLLSESMKFGGKIIIFDKDRGLEIFTRAVEGSYFCLTPTRGTGFAPFQIDDTEDNRHFLCNLLRRIALSSGFNLDAEHEDIIKLAVDGAYQLPKEERILRNIIPFLGMKKSGSLRSCFEAWINKGDFAWIFDNETDELSLDRQVMGYDMTSILDNDRIASVVFYYLFNRIETLIDGTRVRIVGAESWRALQDEEFRQKIKDWSSTPRKKNALLILDTQSPSDIAKSEIGVKIIQETVTQIYFANPSALHSDYVEKFGLSEKEFEIVKSLDKESRFFLLKQGRKSAVVRLHLDERFKDEINVLSGRTNNLKFLESARAEKPDRIEWLPLFYQAVNEEGGQS